MTETTDLPQNLEELYAKQIDFCKKVFDECGEVLPMWVGQDAEGTFYPITSAFSSREEKDATADAVRSIFQKMDVIRYVSMLESWLVVAKADDPKGGPSPANHPDRQEVILITGEDGDNEIFGYFRIIREDGKKPRLSEFERKNGDGFLSKGIFSELLPRKKASAHSSVH